MDQKQCNFRTSKNTDFTDFRVILDYLHYACVYFKVYFMSKTGYF